MNQNLSWSFRLSGMFARLIYGRVVARLATREQFKQMAAEADLWRREMRLRMARDKRKKAERVRIHNDWRRGATIK